MNSHANSLETEIKRHVCPECNGQTCQYRPVDRSVLPRSVDAQNTVRVDHHRDCTRWRQIQRTFPKLIGMRRESVIV